MRICPHGCEPFDDGVEFCPQHGCPLSEADPRLGEIVGGQLRLQAVVGQGAMGTVYRAWQHGVERPVAVKILHRDLANDPDLVARFLREARAVARLSHGHVVTVHMAGVTDDGVPYLVMQLIEGRAMDEALTVGEITQGRAVELATQIASALGEAHAAGIVHRDLKPANVFLERTRRGQEVAKILDFGIAKVLEESLMRPGESHLTRDGAIFGTPQYISPEQAAGGLVDHRADLYSLGVMLYQMVSGRLPFAGGGVPVLVAHMSRPVPPVLEVAPSVDPALAAVIMRLLEKEPQNRYQSADELIEALGQCDVGDCAVARATMAIAEPRAETELGTAETELGRLVAGESSLRLASADRRRRSRRAGTWLGAAALLLGAIGVFGARSASSSASALAEVDSAVVIDRGSDGASPVAGPRRAVMLSGEDYSLRALLPERIETDRDADILLDLWDSAGLPLEADEVVAVIIDPDGDERGALARPEQLPGRFRLPANFARAGDHVLRIMPPEGGASVQVHFDVVDPDQPNS